MSDTFDHELDAWESYERDMDEQDCRRHSSRNPLFYHRRVYIEAILAETDKSLLLMLKGFGDAEIWVPKKIMKKLTDESVWVHSNTFNAILKTHNFTFNKDRME